MPKHLFEKSTLRGLLVVFRDVGFALLLFELAGRIDPWVEDKRALPLSTTAASLLKWSLWAMYWFFQSVVFAGCWVLAHEAGHGTIASIPWMNHIVGFTLHTVHFLSHISW